MADGGEHEAFLTADYNAEMIEHVAGLPQVRDRAVFVGDPDDIVPERFGPDLPLIRDWTEEDFEFPGYVTGFDPASLADRDALRAELGYAPDEQVCIVTVGGSGVGGDLLRGSSRPIPRPRGSAGPAHDRRRRPAHRSRLAALPRRARGAPYVPTSTGTWPPATSRSSRAG